MSNQPPNFDTYEDHDTYFFTEDSLHSLNYDLYFSPTYKYTCRANCQVCYIKDSLRAGFDSFDNKVPAKITDKDEERWFEIFDYFSSIRTNDDLTYMRLHYPKIFEWYQKYQHTFEYGMTDNAILIHQDTLLYHINLKGIADISLSDHFLRRANKDGKVIAALKELTQKYNIVRYKIIRTDQLPVDQSIQSVIDWLNDMGLYSCIYHDLRTNENARFDVGTHFVDYQETNFLSENGRTYRIFQEALQLFNDRFFFGIEDATDLDWDAFHYLKGEFDPRKFLIDTVNGKLKLYDQFANELLPIDRPVVNKFRSYYENTRKFQVHNDFTIIPEFMLSRNTKFYNKLLTKGFVGTQVGLVDPAGKPVPICSYK